MLADDFLGVAPEGTFYGKAKELTDVHAQTEAIVSNQLDGVKVRFYGDTAVAQGKETWERRPDNPRHGHYVWTDTWARIGDKWQIIAAEDVIVPVEKWFIQTVNRTVRVMPTLEALRDRQVPEAAIPLAQPSSSDATSARDVPAPRR